MNYSFDKLTGAITNTITGDIFHTYYYQYPKLYDYIMRMSTQPYYDKEGYYDGGSCNPSVMIENKIETTKQINKKLLLL